MKIVNEPPKTGEEFLVCCVDSDKKVESFIMIWDKESDMFIGIDKDISLSSDKREELFFKGTIILVSKGE